MGMLTAAAFVEAFWGEGTTAVDRAGEPVRRAIQTAVQTIVATAATRNSMRRDLLMGLCLERLALTPR
jgi:hypothetical protein